MFEESIIQTSPCTGGFGLSGASIFIDSQDYGGVRLAAEDLARDLSRVTGKEEPHRLVIADDNNFDPTSIESETGNLIVIGTITSSRIIKHLAQNGHLDLARIQDKWETFSSTIISNPFPHCKNALVITGSDKRGAIFGSYTISEQIGVSPWYWWADVPPKRYDDVFAIPKTTVHGEPSIKYRGIFLNDEAPALTGWVIEKFGKYNSSFYRKIFELLLRLKANFLWPAMWPGYPNPGASFFTDDPETQRLADEYGIVVSTSHHEPMQRLSNEWFGENPDGSWNWLTNKDKITEFFKGGAERAKGCESYFTLGMRGEYDKKMETNDPAAVVQDVLDAQRQVFKAVYGRDDSVPQLFAIYKEVQSLFESGRLNVPEDVTLLFQDDNFGTIRRLPTAAESRRKGGAGVYYHLEYVGWPRSYKWINSNSLGKMLHQLKLAHERNARQIWVFNVGDVKPLEVPITFAMALAWNVEKFRSNDLEPFYQKLAEKTFSSEVSEEVADNWRQYDRLSALRKHEHIEPDTFSILNYNEANLIHQRWGSLVEQARQIHDRVPEVERPAAFQLLLHPAKASYTHVALQIMRARNQLYTRQRRNSANKTAQDALYLFSADYDLSEEFHAMLDGKWNHMMCQPHYGYEETWHAPSRDMISGLGFVQSRQNSNLIVGQMGISVEGHEGIRAGRINEESERTHPSRRDLVPGLTLPPMSRYGLPKRWFEIYTRGRPTICWSASTSKPWARLSCSGGVLVPGRDDALVEVSVEWNEVPDDFVAEVIIDIRSQEGDIEHVHLPIDGRKASDTAVGAFAESYGLISIPATATRIQAPYELLPDTGRLEGGSVSLLPSLKLDAVVPFLEYPFYVFSQDSTAMMVLHFGMTLDYSPEDSMSYDWQVDEQPPVTHKLQQVTEESRKHAAEHGWALADGWFEGASDNIWERKHDLQLAPGYHILRIRLRHSNMLLEKIVIDLGGLRSSYLGPPASLRV